MDAHLFTLSNALIFAKKYTPKATFSLDIPP
jgi:hypothetical protein